MIASRRPFMWKAFVSFAVTLAFAAIAVSGTVLYVAPAGRVAIWSGWRLGALERAEWQAVHTIFALLFVVAGVVHLVFNWRVLLAYVRLKSAEHRPRWRELAVASAAAVGVLALTFAGIAPFSTVMSTGETIKAAWAEGNEPPLPHAEILSLARLADTTHLPLEPMLANAAAAGRAITPETTLADIARGLGVTPAEAFARLTSGLAKPVIPVTEGGGWGQKSVEQVCRQIDVPVKDALDRLHAAGIEADARSNIREVADRHGRMPIEVVKALQGS